MVAIRKGSKDSKSAAPAPAKKVDTSFLANLAAKKPPAKKASGKNEEVTPLSETAQAAIDNWAALTLKAKELKGEIAEAEAIILPEAEEVRVATSQMTREYHSSVKVGGGKMSVTYCKKDAYTGIPVADKNDAVEALAGILPPGKKPGAEKMLDDRIEWKQMVKIKESSLEDPAVIAVLQEHLAEHLDVTMIGKPTEVFHRAASMDPQEKQYMAALVDSGLLSPHKASLRISGGSDE